MFYRNEYDDMGYDYIPGEYIYGERAQTGGYRFEHLNGGDKNERDY